MISSSAFMQLFSHVNLFAFIIYPWIYP